MQVPVGLPHIKEDVSGRSTDRPGSVGSTEVHQGDIDALTRGHLDGPGTPGGAQPCVAAHGAGQVAQGPGHRQLLVAVRDAVVGTLCHGVIWPTCSCH